MPSITRKRRFNLRLGRRIKGDTMVTLRGLGEVSEGLVSFSSFSSRFLMILSLDTLNISPNLLPG
jgi:hypothetical protein